MPADGDELGHMYPGLEEWGGWAESRVRSS